MPAQTQTRHTVRLRPEAFTPRALQSYGWSSLTEAARKCGLAPSTLARCHRGEVDPGATAIAALLRGTGKKFEDLFTIATTTTASAPRPPVVRPASGGHPCSRCGISISADATLCGDCASV